MEDSIFVYTAIFKNGKQVGVCITAKNNDEQPFNLYVPVILNTKYTSIALGRTLEIKETIKENGK